MAHIRFAVTFFCTLGMQKTYCALASSRNDLLSGHTMLTLSRVATHTENLFLLKCTAFVPFLFPSLYRSCSFTSRTARMLQNPLPLSTPGIQNLNHANNFSLQKCIIGQVRILSFWLDAESSPWTSGGVRHTFHLRNICSYFPSYISVYRLNDSNVVHPLTVVIMVLQNSYRALGFIYSSV